MEFLLAVFFHVTAMSSHYVICFDPAAEQMHVIDHTPAETHNSFNEKYGNIPSTLVSVFVALKGLHVAILDRKFSILCFSTNILRMRWKSTRFPA